MMLLMSYGFRAVEIIALLMLLGAALRGFMQDRLRRDNVHQRYALMGMVVAFTLMFWLMPIPIKQPLGFAPHFLGTCLAYWLLGFSGGVVAMLVVVLVAFVFTGFFPQSVMVHGAEVWDSLALLHQAFFSLVVPLVLLSWWRRVCHRIERWWRLASIAKHSSSLLAPAFHQAYHPEPWNAKPPIVAPPTNPANIAPPFAHIHLSQQHHDSSVVDYFLHFFGMVFVGSALASAGAIFLQGFSYWLLEEAGASINLSQSTFPAALLLGYAEAFLTGIVYAALRQFRPSWVFPYD